jgi:hypothetical protein
MGIKRIIPFLQRQKERVQVAYGKKKSGAWLTFVIPSTLEVEKGNSLFEASLGKILVSLYCKEQALWRGSCL